MEHVEHEGGRGGPLQAEAVVPSEDADERLGRRAAQGALWTITTSIGARAAGLAGTLALTRFVAPEVYGEVSLAAVVVQTAQMATSCGLGQYLASKPHAGRRAAFHATFYFLLLGFAALAIVIVARGPIARSLGAPGLAVFVPSLALAGVVERVGLVQDRIQIRDMRFRLVGVVRSIGELTYTLFTVGLAMRGWGGWAIVGGTIARSVVRLGCFFATTDRREWFEPCAITWKRTKELFAFGLPMSLAAFAGFGSRRWDNLVFSSLFGPGVAGAYNLAYNLADIPATQLGETIGDVLVPSFAQMAPARRHGALVRSMTLLTLLVAPLATGLGVVADPLVDLIFDARWQSVAPMLLVLSVLSIVRPVSWIVSAYLQVLDRPAIILGLEIGKTVGLLAAIATLGRLGPVWACAAVGVAFGASAIGYLASIRALERTPIRTLLAPLLPPVAACVPMACAVLAVRHLLAHVGVVLSAGPELGLETATGVLVFVPAALLVAPAASKDLLRLVRTSLRDR